MRQRMDKRLATTIGTAARAARQRAKLTQADVAERLEMATEVYGRLERGLMLPSAATLRKLSVVLAISADELLGLREPDPSAVLTPPSPAHGEGPAIRRLIRRAQGMDSRRLRLLVVLAAALCR